MRLFIALILVLAYISMTSAQTISTSSRNNLLDNGTLLRGLIGDKLTPALTHPTFSDVVQRMQNPQLRSTVLLPLKDVWNDAALDVSLSDSYVKILRHHILNRTIVTAAVKATYPDWQVETSMYNDEPVYVRKNAQGVVEFMSNSGWVAQVVYKDISCSNGVIHLINSGLLPSGFTIANKKLQEKSYVKALDPANLPVDGIYKPGEVPPEMLEEEPTSTTTTGPVRAGPGQPGGPTLPVFASTPLTQADM